MRAYKYALHTSLAKKFSILLRSTAKFFYFFFLVVTCAERAKENYKNSQRVSKTAPTIPTKIKKKNSPMFFI